MIKKTKIRWLSCLLVTIIGVACVPYKASATEATSEPVPDMTVSAGQVLDNETEETETAETETVETETEETETVETETVETETEETETVDTTTETTTDIYTGGSVRGNIVVDGNIEDWAEVSGIQINSEKAEGWKVALSPDKTMLYLCMYGTTSNEWDYNFQYNKVTFTCDGQATDVYPSALTSQISGSQMAMTNEAYGNVPGDYAIECAIPVSALPTSNYTISLLGADILAANIPILDGNDVVSEPEENAVYTGITIDGNFSDWAAVAKTEASCPSAEHPDCLEQVAMVYDGDYVYIYMEAGGPDSAPWGGTHSNSKFAITADLGYAVPFTVNSDNTISGLEGATCQHYGNMVEIAIPKSALPTYLESISFGYYLQPAIISGVTNLQPEETKTVGDIVYDGLYGDWTYYPHEIIQYATAGTQENVTDGVGALYYNGTDLLGHVKTTMPAHLDEEAGAFTKAVTFKFGESEFAPRFVTVDENGNINWEPQVDDLANGTYEFYILSLDAWHTSTNIAELHEMDQVYGKMTVTLSDMESECEFYLDLEAVAKKLGCSPQEFKTMEARFGRIGPEWLMTAGASSGAVAGVLISLASVGIVLGIRRKKRGITG